MDLEILSNLNNKIKESLKLMSGEEINILSKITPNIRKIIKNSNNTELNFIKNNLIDTICELKNNNLTFNYYNNLELFNFLEYDSKLYFNLTNNYYYNNFKIKKMDIYKEYLLKAAEYHIYAQEIKVDRYKVTYYNLNPKNCNNFVGLKSLSCYHSYFAHYKNLNLTKLKINSELVMINNINNLKILDIDNHSNLKILDIDNYSNLKNILNNTKLIKLNCNINSCFPLDSIPTLKSLNIQRNADISILSDSNNSNLVELVIGVGNNIDYIDNMINLKKLVIYNKLHNGFLFPLDEHLKMLNLVELNIISPIYINMTNTINIDHMTKLKTLKLYAHIIENKKNLNLIELELIYWSGDKFVDTNNIPNLKILTVYRYINFQLIGVENLNLIKFNDSNAGKDLTNMKNLKILNHKRYYPNNN